MTLSTFLSFLLSKLLDVELMIGKQTYRQMDIKQNAVSTERAT